MLGGSYSGHDDRDSWLMDSFMMLGWNGVMDANVTKKGLFVGLID